VHITKPKHPDALEVAPPISNPLARILYILELSNEKESKFMTKSRNEGNFQNLTP
jgi:hypothetical protein